MKAYKVYSDQIGFTYIEMLIVIALVAICFVPLLHMFTQSMSEVAQYSDVGTALQLGRNTTELVRNLRLTEAQIESQDIIWTPDQKEPPLLLNGHNWRVKRRSVKGTDPLEVHVEVFHAEDMNKPVLELVTLIEDL